MLAKSRIPLLLGAVTVITALGATMALGTTTKRFDSTVTLSANNPFHGSVVSKKHACETDRTVKIFNKKPGPDGLFGTTKTNNKGEWSKPAMPSGKFYAVVKKRREGTAGTIFVCGGDTSPVRDF
jgi:hypothetical protein